MKPHAELSPWRANAPIDRGADSPATNTGKWLFADIGQRRTGNNVTIACRSVANHSKHAHYPLLDVAGQNIAVRQCPDKLKSGYEVHPVKFRLHKCIGNNQKEG